MRSDSGARARTLRTPQLLLLQLLLLLSVPLLLLPPLHQPARSHYPLLPKLHLLSRSALHLQQEATWRWRLRAKLQPWLPSQVPSRQ